MSDYFPSELLIEILLRLPVKSLIRFTTVCKAWYYLITSRAFISAHLSNPRNRSLLLRRYDKHDRAEHYSLLKVSENGPFCINSSTELKFPFKSQIGYFRIVGSCDGIVCLSDDFFANPSRPVVLWNPCVQNYLLLPEAIVNPREPHIFVLGFGVSDQDYKVVRLVYRRKADDFGYTGPPEVEIFSLRKGKWRRLKGVNVRLQIVDFMWSQAFLNGNVHWLGYEELANNSTRSSILSFEVGTEVFDELLLPVELSKEPVTNMCITPMDGLLAVMNYCKEVGRESCDVWVMKEYGLRESWNRLCCIQMVEGMERIVAFWKNGEALVASEELELLAYDLETRQSNNLGIHGTTRSFYLDNYVESLLLLKQSGNAVEFNGVLEEELSLDGCCIT